MHFTKNIILEALRPYRGSQHLNKYADRTFRWVAMLPGDSDEMRADILYVCRLSEAMKRNGEAPGYCYLCVRDCFTDDDEDAELLSGIIIINEKKDVSWLFNIAQERLLQISEWLLKMQEALIDNCDYQRLIDLCEPILGNFVSILDASYKLLAYTKNISSPDPINTSLVEKGYHTEESMQKFKKAKRFRVYEREHGVIISGAGEISQFEVVSRWCRYGGEPLLHVVMVCSQTPLSQASIELFEMFMRHIDHCFYREQRAHPSRTYSSLLSEMLYGGLANPFTIAERAKTADVPFSGNFDAYRIVFKDNSTVLVGRFVQELETNLTKSKIIANNYEVSVLNVYSSPEVRRLSSGNLARLASLFDKYGAICGVSEAFTSLPEFSNACTQATRAQALGIQLREPGNFWNFDKEVFEAASRGKSADVFFYDDVYIYLMLHFAQAGSFDVFNNTLYNRALKELLEYDKKNDARLVQVLYAYLISERRATAAGKLLHMHRNNVLYHVSRIEEITGIDLGDYWARLKLMLAFHFFELQESNRTFMAASNEL